MKIPKELDFFNCQFGDNPSPLKNEGIKCLKSNIQAIKME